MSAVATPVSPQENSTTVRTDYARVPPLVRGSFQLASRLIPNVAAAAAEYVFFRPHLRSANTPGAPRRRTLEVANHRVATYVWGDEGPAVLLVHGWQGSAAQMAPLAWALAADGQRVVAVDLPAHGQSRGASETNLPEVVWVLGRLRKALGPFSAVVGHSFGAVAAMVFARHHGTERVVTIGGPASLWFVIQSFAHAVGLGDVAAAEFRRRLERRFGAEMWQQLSPRQLAADLDAPALVVHDQDDGAVPIEQARDLVAAWPRARLLSTAGLGHYRVLRSPEVHRAVCHFLQPGVSP